MSEVAKLDPRVHLERVPGYITPELEADFAAQVEETHATGDFLSRSKLSAVGLVAGSAVGSMVNMSTRWIDEGHYVASGLAVTAAASSGAIASLSIFKASYKGQHNDIHTAPNGQRFSLFASGLGKRRRTSVMLHGVEPDKEMKTVDEIRVGAQLAHKNGLSDMIVPIEKAQVIPIPDRAKVLPLHTWLGKQRGDAAPPKGEETNVYVASPKAWLKSLESADTKQESTSTETDYVNKLRSIAPDHPVVKAYDFYKADKILQQVRTRSAVIAGIESDLQSSETVPNSEIYRPPTPVLASQKSIEKPVLQRNTHMPARSRQASIIGTLGSDSSRVRWTDQQGMTREEDVFSALGLSSETVEMLVEHPEVNPRMAAKVLGIKLAQVLAGNDTSLAVASHAELLTNGPTEHEGVRRSALKPIVIMTIGIYAVSIGGMVKQAIEGPGPNSVASAASHVGNVGSGGANFKEWNLQSHGLSPHGYWPMRTSYQYKDGEWISGGAIIGEGALTPTSLPNNFDEWIAVDRKLKGGDIVGDPKDALDQVVRVPELEGTHIAAANIDGKPVVLQQQEDGSMFVSLPDSAGADDTLKYWLVEGEDHAIRATKNVEALNKNSLVDQIAIDEYWLKALDGKLPSMSSMRMDAQREYIASKFKYALDPYEDDDFTKDHTPAKIVRHALENNRRANCNVTSAMLAFSNSELNVVTGYLMDGKDTSLNTASLHSWNVTPYGKRIDGTPTSGASKEDQEALSRPETTEESKKAKDLEKMGAYGIGAGITAGLLIEHRRIRRSKRVAQRGIGRVAGALLDRRGESLKVSYDLLGQAVYSKDGHVDLDGARERAGRSPLSTGEIAARLRDRNDLSGLQTLRQLREQRKNLAPMTRRAVRRARIAARLARLSRWANPPKRTSRV